MNKPVFVFDLNMLLPAERVEELRADLAAQIESGVLILGNEVTFVEVIGAPGGTPEVVFVHENEPELAE